ncbi:MAG: AAA family ATPase [Spirochaetales bacterium]|nr:AAA family ATPase [Spirochaetales bacterium]
MIYIRKLFTQDLRDGKQIAFPKEPSYDFFKFDYQNNEADRNIEFTFETNNEKYITFEGKKIQTRLYAARSESRIDGELKAFIRDDLKIEIDDLLILQSDGKNNSKFKFNVILKDDEEYPLYMKIISSANHSLIEDKGAKLQSEKIDKPHNRIIFGAPGTGKSYRLSIDAEKYFMFNETKFLLRLDNLKKEAISYNKDNNSMSKGAYFTMLGFKYYDVIDEYIHKNNNKDLKQELGIDDFPKDQILSGCGAAKEIGYNISPPNKKGTNLERVTFHPNYSYAQLVGTYKPVSSTTDMIIDDEQKRVLQILQNQNMSAQQKYDSLYKKFKDNNTLTRLPLLVGIYSDDDFKTRKADGTPAANDNDVEKNHGKAIRPFINLSSNSNSEIKYEYVPGPFMRVYVAAKNNPSQNFLLIIEEINRANVAAVFGDVFQLLDRKSDGTSEYPITASEDIKKYLERNGIEETELSIPSNMYIWATMNSADQGVFPMDTAFKRRWEFEYIGIDDNEDKVKDYEIPIPNGKNVKWNNLRKAINNRLISLGINEDKLLGPFFLSKSILENAMNDTDNFVKLFKSKVLMYLFEDAAKMKVGQIFNINNDKKIFSEICKKFDKDGVDVFTFNGNDKETVIGTDNTTDNSETS